MDQPEYQPETGDQDDQNHECLPPSLKQTPTPLDEGVINNTDSTNPEEGRGSEPEPLGNPAAENPCIEELDLSNNNDHVASSLQTHEEEETTNIPEVNLTAETHPVTTDDGGDQSDEHTLSLMEPQNAEENPVQTIDSEIEYEVSNTVPVADYQEGNVVEPSFGTENVHDQMESPHLADPDQPSSSLEMQQFQEESELSTQSEQHVEAITSVPEYAEAPMGTTTSPTGTGPESFDFPESGLAIASQQESAAAAAEDETQNLQNKEDSEQVTNLEEESADTETRELLVLSQDREGGMDEEAVLAHANIDVPDSMVSADNQRQAEHENDSYAVGSLPEEHRRDITESMEAPICEVTTGDEQVDLNEPVEEMVQQHLESSDQANMLEDQEPEPESLEKNHEAETCEPAQLLVSTSETVETADIPLHTEDQLLEESIHEGNEAEMIEEKTADIEEYPLEQNADDFATEVAPTSQEWGQIEEEKLDEISNHEEVPLQSQDFDTTGIYGTRQNEQDEVDDGLTEQSPVTQEFDQNSQSFADGMTEDQIQQEVVAAPEDLQEVLPDRTPDFSESSPEEAKPILTNELMPTSETEQHAVLEESVPIRVEDETNQLSQETPRYVEAQPLWSTPLERTSEIELSEITETSSQVASLEPHATDSSFSVDTNELKAEPEVLTLVQTTDSGEVGDLVQPPVFATSVTEAYTEEAQPFANGILDSADYTLPHSDSEKYPFEHVLVREDQAKIESHPPREDVHELLTTHQVTPAAKLEVVPPETTLTKERQEPWEGRPVIEIKQKSRTLEPQLFGNKMDGLTPAVRKAATLGRAESHRRPRLQPKPTENDDHLFPESVTPSKVDKELSVRSLSKGLPKGTYDVPYIDDDAFLPKHMRQTRPDSTMDGSNSDYSSEGLDWYEPAMHAKYSTLDQAHVADINECVPSPTLVPKLKSRQKMKKSKKEPKLIKEKTRESKRRMPFIFCGCLSRQEKD